MVIRPQIEKIRAFLVDSPWMANLTTALESKTNVALIVGIVDNVAFIRDHFGHISLDHVLPVIEKVLHERFEGYSVSWGTVFLILLTGNEAKNAVGVAESIRATVENMSFDERFNITMHFGLTEASSNWAVGGRLRGLLNAADTAIQVGERNLVTNRVYEPANLNTYEDTITKKR
jgi:PleD family two-component response regulator